MNLVSQPLADTEFAVVELKANGYSCQSDLQTSCICFNCLGEVAGAGPDGWGVTVSPQTLSRSPRWPTAWTPSGTRTCDHTQKTLIVGQVDTTQRHKLSGAEQGFGLNVSWVTDGAKERAGRGRILWCGSGELRATGMRRRVSDARGSGADARTLGVAELGSYAREAEQGSYARGICLRGSLGKWW
ncbi:hypothetical protein B0H11DRAFT_1938274 [Mycena galericulata]|nr:hypothetical protein B0H11DRAFT_1938274 [Mycena galericulata]